MDKNKPTKSMSQTIVIKQPLHREKKKKKRTWKKLIKVSSKESIVGTAILFSK